MPYRTDIEYTYDGTLNGFLCCVYHAFRMKENPCRISPEATHQESLLPCRSITTQLNISKRVWESFTQKFGLGAKQIILAAYLNCEADKEVAILDFLRLAYSKGTWAFTAYAYPEVSRFQKLSRATQHEAHLFKGLVRFEEYNGALAAVIEPKHSPLPLMRPHFVDRYPEERFLIYDKTNHLALAYRPHEWKMFSADSLKLPEMQNREAAMQLLWAQYYKTIAIRSRYNPKCRMTHMPKRFWGQLTEIQRSYILDEQRGITPCAYPEGSGKIPSAYPHTLP